MRKLKLAHDDEESILNEERESGDDYHSHCGVVYLGTKASYPDEPIGVAGEAAQVCSYGRRRRLYPTSCS